MFDPALCAFVNDNHNDWKLKVPYVTMAYKPLKPETINFTPCMCMFGRTVHLILSMKCLVASN